MDDHVHNKISGMSHQNGNNHRVQTAFSPDTTFYSYKRFMRAVKTN